MESKELVLIYGRFLCILGNQISSKLIIKYLKSKPPLFQTLKDLLFMDLIQFVSNFCFVLMTSMICSRLFFAGVVPPWLGMTVAFVLDILQLLAAIKLFIFLAAKYLSIYHSPLLSDLDETEVSTQIYWSAWAAALTSNVMEYLTKAGDGNFENLMAYQMVTKGDVQGGKPPLMPAPFMVLSFILAIYLQFRLERDNLRYQDGHGSILAKFQHICHKNSCTYGPISLIIATMMVLSAILGFYFIFPLIETPIFRATFVSGLFLAIFVAPNTLYIVSNKKIKSYVKKLIMK